MLEWVVGEELLHRESTHQRASTAAALCFFDKLNDVGAAFLFLSDLVPWFGCAEEERERGQAGTFEVEQRK